MCCSPLELKNSFFQKDSNKDRNVTFICDRGTEGAKTPRVGTRNTRGTKEARFLFPLNIITTPTPVTQPFVPRISISDRPRVERGETGRHAELRLHPTSPEQGRTLQPGYHDNGQKTLGLVCRAIADALCVYCIIDRAVACS